jgi:HEAT repeat protein
MKATHKSQYLVALFLTVLVMLSLGTGVSAAEEACCKAAAAGCPVDMTAFLATMANASATLRYPAWTNAEKFCAKAIVPLGERMDAADRSLTQDLKRAMERIVHNVGRPGADDARKAVAGELSKLIAPERSNKVKTEVLDLLGFIADDSNLPAMGALLDNQEVREEACRAIQRVPGRAATELLEKKLDSAPADFQPRLLAALGQRQDPSVGPALEAFLTKASGELKLQALVALSKSGAPPPSGMRRILEAVKDLGDQDLRANLRLRFADNLAKKGDIEHARRLYENLSKGEVSEQIQLAAKAGLEQLGK